MKTRDFDYYLPPQLIAQTPLEPRDHSRLMVVSRGEGSIEHRRFFEIPALLRPGDVLVFNNSRVLPARLLGRKQGTGARVGILLLRRGQDGLWEALARPGRRLPPGTKIELPLAEGDSPAPSLLAEVVEEKEAGIRVLRFSDESALERVGQVPLPPYIRAPLQDPERYQTVYARVKGSVAAPTAGLHFTAGLLQKLEKRGVEFAFVTLHVGLDSFRPVQVADPRHHPRYKEFGELSAEVADQLNQAKREGRRLIAVGTTTVRLLEEVALQVKKEGAAPGPLQPFSGGTELLILPGHDFLVIDGLLTNFHLPRSTLLMLVSALAGRDLIQRAYAAAISLGYRFYSFGDCMLIV